MERAIEKKKQRIKKIPSRFLNTTPVKKRKTQNPFTFDRLVNKLQTMMKEFPDRRTGKNINKKLEDAAIGAFSIFFTQNPSFLAYQTEMQRNKGKNNASSIFGVYEILSDNHIRHLLDNVSPDHVFPLFSNIFTSMQKNGYLDEYRSFRNNFLLAVDGVQYFTSKKIHCSSCSQKEHQNGDITYFHSAITPVIVASGKKRVISLEPEFIMPQDGKVKQDCELSAAKRWFAKHASTYKGKAKRFTILGDDLYCKQPFCRMLLEKGEKETEGAFDFILVCKPDSHKTTYEYLQLLAEDIQKVEVRRWTGKIHETDIYRFLNGVPLRDGKDAMEINWCEICTIDDEGKIKYKNAFATNFLISKENVTHIVADGRTRWKIENENNNVLKNNGYNLAHNFGHGKKYLSMLLLTFNLLAFLFHTVLEFMDERYYLVRLALPSRKTFFSDLRALTRYLLFDNWNDLILFMMKGLKLEVPNTS